jgi:hypothetical protein
LPPTKFFLRKFASSGAECARQFTIREEQSNLAGQGWHIAGREEERIPSVLQEFLKTRDPSRDHRPTATESFGQDSTLRDSIVWKNDNLGG